ncbi:MAG: hypothetical protein U7123_19670 [Potamolinea sp.]
MSAQSNAGSPGELGRWGDGETGKLGSNAGGGLEDNLMVRTANLSTKPALEMGSNVGTS